ncbi:DNA mismatch repair endonuclease MutH [Aestuariibacter salexigens]|uniref:DNA mismatch repair endonuclease MutH n=1 Tax=Aestuariibacter salexigens TaxID=226010 RepID=UPI00040D6DA1|nr:DNA mismatch repair endonuclease MutH [Aestuariibacter salexigens]
MHPPTTPPDSEQELLCRARQLAGLPLGTLASLAGIKTPENFKREKGWTGQLIELWLGATAGSKPQQDFPHLGIELKTLPINDAGNPLETTYVCYAPLTNVAGITWENSNVRNKLSRVLWCPVQGERHLPPAQRRMATPFLWTPTGSQLEQLRQDWEELMDMISLGQVEAITARQGVALQLRPKAADGSKLTDAVGFDGTSIQTRPRGFYLRKTFTKALLADAFSIL